MRVADVPARRVRELSEGRAEATTLVEWLAADTPTLLRHVLPQVGLPGAWARLAGDPERLAALGAKARLEAIGEAVAGELERVADPEAAARRLLDHPSNYPREWLAFAVAARPGLTLGARLERMRPLAADPNLNVRESAWLALRHHVAADVRAAVDRLAPWARDPEPAIRRFAVEATRPRGVWSRHIPELKREPAIGLPLLEPVRSDASDYVRRAVANWLNDARKTRPAWVEALCARWRRESSTEQTAWICARAMRA